MINTRIIHDFHSESTTNPTLYSSKIHKLKRDQTKKDLETMLSNYETIELAKRAKVTSTGITLKLSYEEMQDILEYYKSKSCKN